MAIIKMTIKDDLNGHEARTVVACYAEYKKLLSGARDIKEVFETLTKLSITLYRLMISYTQHPLKTIKLFPEIFDSVIS